MIMNELKHAFIEAFKEGLALQVFVEAFKEGLAVFFSPFTGFWHAVKSTRRSYATSH